jgi:hypothetical protein
MRYASRNGKNNEEKKLHRNLYGSIYRKRTTPIDLAKNNPFSLKEIFKS